MTSLEKPTPNIWTWTCSCAGLQLVLEPELPIVQALGVLDELTELIHYLLDSLPSLSQIKEKGHKVEWRCDKIPWCTYNQYSECWASMRMINPKYFWSWLVTNLISVLFSQGLSNATFIHMIHGNQCKSAVNLGRSFLHNQTLQNYHFHLSITLCKSLLQSCNTIFYC